MIYLSLVGALALLALVKKASFWLALPAALNLLATVVLESMSDYRNMIWADAATFAVMFEILRRHKQQPKWALIATGLMALPIFVHLGYYSLGSDRYPFSLVHMYALQALYAAAVAVLVIGGYDVFQRMASFLERRRGSGDHVSGSVWARDCDLPGRHGGNQEGPA